MLPVLLAVACLADTTNWTPTPTYRWNHDAVDTAGYRIYWRNDDTIPGWWDGHFDIPVERYLDDDGNQVVFSPGRDLSWPIQRAIDHEGVLIDFVVVAYDEAGNESAPTPIQQLCLPELWQFGEVYR